MTTKLDTIKTAVANHFADHEAREAEYGDKIVTDEHAAMCLLRDLLPLLDAAVIWDDIRWDTPKGEQVKRLVDLHTEIIKLGKEK